MKKKLLTLLFAIFTVTFCTIAGSIFLTSDNSKSPVSSEPAVQTAAVPEVPKRIQVSPIGFGNSSYPLVSGSVRTYQIDNPVLTYYGYGFKINEKGWFESLNKGVNNSYSMMKLQFDAKVANASFTIKYISYAENNYDFGIFSNLDTTLTEDSNADTTNVFKSAKGEYSASEKSITYSNISVGTHFIYIKFRKDGSTHSYNDTLQIHFEMDYRSQSDIYMYKYLFAGQKIGTLPTAGTKSGNTFVGWWTESSSAGSSAGIQVDEDTAIYGNSTVHIWMHFVSSTRTVTYNANGGTATASTKTVGYNDKYGKLATATRSGYMFNGWWTAASGGTEISDASICTSDITLYAHWVTSQYTLTLNPNGGRLSTIPGRPYYDLYSSGYYTTDPLTKMVGYNDLYGYLQPASRTGYTFNGWYTAASGGSRVYETTTYSTSGNLTIYAQWSINSYTITVKSSGVGIKSVSGSGTYTYGSSVTISAVAETGYSVRWDDGNKSATRTITVSYSRTYTATAIIGGYAVDFNFNGASKGSISSINVETRVEGSGGGGDDSSDVDDDGNYKFKQDEEGWFVSTGQNYGSNISVAIVEFETYIENQSISVEYVFAGGQVRFSRLDSSSFSISYTYVILDESEYIPGNCYEGEVISYLVPDTGIHKFAIQYKPSSDLPFKFKICGAAVNPSDEILPFEYIPDEKIWLTGVGGAGVYIAKVCLEGEVWANYKIGYDGSYACFAFTNMDQEISFDHETLDSIYNGDSNFVYYHDNSGSSSEVDYSGEINSDGLHFVYVVCFASDNSHFTLIENTSEFIGNFTTNVIGQGPGAEYTYVTANAHSTTGFYVAKVRVRTLNPGSYMTIRGYNDDSSDSFIMVGVLDSELTEQTDYLNIHNFMSFCDYNSYGEIDWEYEIGLGDSSEHFFYIVAYCNDTNLRYAYHCWFSVEYPDSRFYCSVGNGGPFGVYSIGGVKLLNSDGTIASGGSGWTRPANQYDFAQGSYNSAYSTYNYYASENGSYDEKQFSMAKVTFNTSYANQTITLSCINNQSVSSCIHYGILGKLDSVLSFDTTAATTASGNVYYTFYNQREDNEINVSYIVPTPGEHYIMVKYLHEYCGFSHRFQFCVLKTDERYVKYNTSYGALPSPTRSYYSLKGWYTAASGGTQVTSSTTCSTASNHTLYAQWNPTPITVTTKFRLIEIDGTYTNVDNNEGGEVSFVYTGISGTSTITNMTETQTTASASRTAHQGQAFKMTASPKGGYIFAGYSTSATPTTSMKNLTTSTTTTSTFYPTSTSTTYYVYFKRVRLSDNKLKYDETDKCFYFEDGYYPQSDENVMQLKPLHVNGTNLSGITITYESDNTVVLNGTLTPYSTTPILYTEAETYKFKQGLWVISTYTKLSGNVSGSGQACWSTEVCKSDKSNVSTRNFVDKYNNFADSTEQTQFQISSSGASEGAHLRIQVYCTSAFTFNNLKFRIDIQYDRASELEDIASATGESFSYCDGKNNVSIPVYNANGEKFVKIIKNGASRWFKFEPIRWRISDYGVEKTEINIARYTSLYKLRNVNSYASDFTAVSDLILGVGAMHNTRVIDENLKTDDGTLSGTYNRELVGYQNVMNTTNGVNLNFNYSASLSQIDVERYGCTEIGEGTTVKNSVEVFGWTEAYSAELRAVSMRELEIVGFVNKQARASDMVAFILGCDKDQVSYWTRDLSNLGAGVAITPTGTEIRPWLDEVLGMRFAYTFREGSNAF